MFDFTEYIDMSTEITENVHISTICASCLLPGPHDLDTLYNNTVLDSNSILAIKFTNSTFKSLIPLSSKKNKITQYLQNKFYNQITFLIRISEGETTSLKKEPKINLKLFCNGSVQMSGCKSIYSINKILNKFINTLKLKKTVLNFKLDMINYNFRMPYHINRTKLYEILHSYKIPCFYDLSMRACVIIHYNHINIFVFERENIVIHGCKNKNDVQDSYLYITKLLKNNIKSIKLPCPEVSKKILVDLIKQCTIAACYKI